MGDLVRPLRRMIDGYDDIEGQLLESLWDYYDVAQPSESEWEPVMHADDKVLMWEIDRVFEDDDVKQEIIADLHSKNGWDRSSEELIDEVARDCRLEYTSEEARRRFEDSHENLLTSI